MATPSGSLLSSHATFATKQNIAAASVVVVVVVVVVPVVVVADCTLLPTHLLLIRFVQEASGESVGKVFWGHELYPQ